MTLLAEVVDAVVGGDTHREMHTLEMVAPDVTIAALSVSNDDAGVRRVIAGHARARRSLSAWREHAATASGWPVPWLLRA